MESSKLVNRTEIEIKTKIETIAKQILKDMGIKVHHLGFKYWVTAIYITLDIDLNNRPELKMMELYYNVTYSINNTALLFLLKEVVKEKYLEDNLYILPREHYQPKVLLCNKKVNTPK